MKIVSKGAEAKLLEVVSGLRSSPDGYYALHYNLSRLQEEFRSDYQIKISVNVLNDLFKAQDSIAFVCEDCDLILLYNGSNRALLEKAIFQLRYLFMDDPLGYTEDGFENEDFCSVYDLEFQWRDFHAACKRKVGKEETILESEKAAEAASNIVITRARRQLFSPEYLVQVMGEISKMDISPLLTSQPVCAIVKGRKPKILFKEVYTHIVNLQKMLTVNIDLLSSKSLFKYMTKLLDKKVLAALKEQAEVQAKPISINLNAKSLMTEEFAEFDSVIAKKNKSSIIIEIHIADVFEDIDKFILAKETIQKLGYRICLDGLNETSFLQIDRAGLGFDLAKITWNPEMGTKKHEEMDKLLKSAVQKCGANRIVMCRCDSQNAIDFGKSIGISLFQGHYIEEMLEKEIKAA